MAKDKSLDSIVRKMCRKKMTDPDAPLLKERFCATEAIAAALVKKAIGGGTDAVKLIREITDCGENVDSTFKVEITVVE